MASDEGSGGRRPGAVTHLPNASQETWDALRNEPGLATDGNVHRTRRGSFMLQVPNGDGTHNVSILHSVRTANLIERMEAFGAEPASASERPKRGEKRAREYARVRIPRVSRDDERTRGAGQALCRFPTGWLSRNRIE